MNAYAFGYYASHMHALEALVVLECVSSQDPSGHGSSVLLHQQLYLVGV